MVPFPYFRGTSTHYSDRLYDFSITIPRCYKDVYVKSFFPRTTRLWNSLPIECFPSTVSFLAYLDSGILCLQNAFLCSMILVALSLQLTHLLTVGTF